MFDIFRDIADKSVEQKEEEEELCTTCLYR